MLLTHATLATMSQGYGLIPDAAVALEGDRIAWAGPMADLPTAYRGLTELDCEGRLVTPGLIDCHGHPVYGGHRAVEFELRLQGASYEEVARAGGGILSTVTATRAASEDQLLTSALTRVDQLIASGATTIEVKSGYGLTIEDELKMLRAARRIARARRVTVKTAHLAAHAIPPEYKGRNAAYIAEVAIPSLRAAHSEGLVDAVDAFCEGIAFSVDELRPLYAEALSLGLPVKLHAEQLSDLGGAAFAAGLGALSADHLEYLSAGGIAAMAKSGTVAVILPGAFYTLREGAKPALGGVVKGRRTESSPQEQCRRDEQYHDVNQCVSNRSHHVGAFISNHLPRVDDRVLNVEGREVWQDEVNDLCQNLCALVHPIRFDHGLEEWAEQGPEHIHP